MNTIGVVGLGVMGSAMAQRLKTQGWRVLGVDPRIESANQLSSPAEMLSLADAAARADHLVLSLPGPPEVRDVVEHIIDMGSFTGVVVDTSTSDPDLSRELCALAEAVSIDYVDSPVSGGRSGALAGTLRSFVGGSERAVHAARPVLDALTSGGAMHVGGPGAGHLVKLLNNAMVAAHLAIAAEAVATADHYGVDAELFITAINGASGRSAVTEVNIPSWVLTKAFDSGFSVGLTARDVDLATKAAQPAHLGSGLLAATSDTWRQLLTALGPVADFNLAVSSIRQTAREAALALETSTDNVQRFPSRK